jgi:hypothetical protein
VIDEALAARLIAAWKEWIESRPLAELLPKERAIEAVRRIAHEKAAAEELAPRIEKAFDATYARLRALERSAADLLGPRITARLVEAAADLEPDERAIRAFFEERAVGDLLGAVLYDGITEFFRKANQLSDALPGMSAAKKLAGGVGGLLGALGGGLAGSIAGGLREEMEKKLEQQVRGFLAGFGKIAVDRAIRFATSPQNQKLFREMRANLARKALAMPVRELVAKLPPERAAELRKRLVDAALRAASDERATRALEARIEKLAAERGGELLSALAKRTIGDVLPTDPVARLLAPGLARFLDTESAKTLLKDLLRNAGS